MCNPSHTLTITQKVGAAQKVAPGKVDLALSLIGYGEEVNAAMDYVFGTTLVCEDAETAKRVTFDPAVRMKSVTLEGDVYDPAGTLSGGSAPQSSGVLVTLQKLNGLIRELTAQEDALAALQATMARERKRLDAARKMKQELDLKTHEIKLTEDQISGNSSSSVGTTHPMGKIRADTTQIIQAVEEMEANVAQLKQDIVDARARYEEASKEAKRIERDMHEFSNNKDSKLAELQASLDKLKKALSKNSAAIKPLQQEMRDAMLESEQCGSDLAAAQEQLQDADTTLAAQQEEVNTLAAEQARVKVCFSFTGVRLSLTHKRKLTIWLKRIFMTNRQS